MTSEAMLQQEFGSIPALIATHAEMRPAHPALVHGERVMDYRALDALMNRVAASLQRDGVQAGDVVAICAGTSIEYAATFLGILRAGAAVAPLSPASTAEQLVSMLSDSGAKLFFLDAVTAALLKPVKFPGSVRRIALYGSNAGLPFSQWLADETSRPHAAAIEPDGPCNLIYSSGTTGTPKGVVQPNRMRWAHVRRAMRYGYGPDTISLISTPLYSNTTLVAFLPTIGCGGTAVLMEKFDPEKFLTLAERHRVTHAMLVPVQYKRLLEFPGFGGFDLASFRMKFCTSAPFSASLKAEILKRWPGGLVEYYGLTEGGGTVVLLAHEFPEKLHTVGQPVPGHDIRLIGEDGNEVAAGEAGEVVGHSPGMMSGYHNRPDMTAAAEWFDESGKRFIRTGDIGRFDADGFLTLIDRRKDMIISGGFNIYPSDLEAVLSEHPAVSEAAVVGLPSETWGETPVAFIVLKPGVAADPEEIRSWANARLGKIQRLAEVRIETALPRNTIGKVLKRELRGR